MPWPRPSARIIICTKPVWRLDLCYGEAPRTLAQLCGGGGTPSLSNFGVIRHVFPPQPFYLSWSSGETSRAPAARPGPGELAGRFWFPIVSYFRFRERLLNLHVLTVLSTENAGVAKLGQRCASALGIQVWGGIIQVNNFNLHFRMTFWATFLTSPLVFPQLFCSDKLCKSGLRSLTRPPLLHFTHFLWHFSRSFSPLYLRFLFSPYSLCASFENGVSAAAFTPKGCC